MRTFLFLILSITVCMSSYIYTVKNDFEDGGIIATLQVPDTCEPEDGFIEYNSEQTYSCDRVPLKNETFLFQGFLPYEPYVRLFNCMMYKNNTCLRVVESC